MLTVKKLYDFLKANGIEDNSISILYRDPDADKVCWIDYEENKQKALEEIGLQEVEGADIYVKD